MTIPPGGGTEDATTDAGDHVRGRRGVPDPAINVRASDLEPYTGLRYLSTLFRIMAVLLVLLLVAEAAAGALAEGRASVPTLLAEASRLLVLAGILWGIGDLAHLLIDVGHDVRASRILLARQVAHHEHTEQHVRMHAASDLPERQQRPLAPADRAASGIGATSHPDPASPPR